MLHLAGRSRLAAVRWNHTWWAWTIILIVIASCPIAHINHLPQLAQALVVVSLILVIGIVPYMWMVENKIQCELNTVRKQHGMKEIIGKERFWSYIKR